MNISSYTLSKYQEEVLNLGKGFVPSKKYVNKKDIIDCLKIIKRKLRLKDYFKKDTPIDKSKFYIKNSKWIPPIYLQSNRCLDALIKIDDLTTTFLTTDRIDTGYKNNLSREHRIALSNLQNNENLVIRKADKGNLLVLMDKSDYIYEAETQLSDQKYYCRIDHHINNSYLINPILLQAYTKKIIDIKLFKYLQPDVNAKPRKFYTLPKIHKDKDKWLNGRIPKGRPIISDLHSLTYNISQFLEFKLKSLSKYLKHIIKDSRDFIAKIHEFNASGCILATADVESLYTNMNNDLSIKIVADYFQKFIPTDNQLELTLKLLDISLNSNDFIFNDKIYLQTNGTAMGKAYSPTLANIYLDSLDRLATQNIKVVFYGRYIDDIFIIFNGSSDELKSLERTLNSFIPQIKLTFESSRTSVNFLDINVFRTEEDAMLRYKVYFKPTSNLNLLHHNSNHPKHTFSGIVKSQFIRYKYLTYDYNDYKATCFNLINSLRKRGYPYHKMRKIFRLIPFFNKNFTKNNDNKNNNYKFIIVRNSLPAMKKFFHKVNDVIYNSNIIDKGSIINAYKVDKNISRQLF